MAKTLTLTDEEHRILATILREIVENVAPEDLHATLAEAIPSDPSQLRHPNEIRFEAWQELLQKIDIG